MHSGSRGAGGCPTRSSAWSCGGSDHSLESEGSQDSGQYHVCAHHSQCFLSFMEELRVLKRAKKWLENHWGKMNKSVRPQIIKAYLMAVRAVKCKYFSALIASAVCHPVTLFEVTQSLPREGGLIRTFTRLEEFVKHLMDKIA